MMVATQRRTAPRPGNGGARQGSGPLRQVMTWKPFGSRKSNAISSINVDITRCNYCGAIGIDGYTEIRTNGLCDIFHDEQPMQHRDDCPLKDRT